jgi:hypothetical protein
LKRFWIGVFPEKKHHLHFKMSKAIFTWPTNYMATCRLGEPSLTAYEGYDVERHDLRRVERHDAFDVLVMKRSGALV